LSLPKLAEWVEGTKPARYGMAIFCVLVGIGGLWSGVRQKHELGSQINQLVNAAVTQASKDDLRMFGDRMDAGFDRVVKAINLLSKGRVVRPEETHPKPPALLPPPEHIRYTESRAPSTIAGSPYGLQAIIQTDATIQPVSIGITCDGEIYDAKAFVAGIGVMMSVAEGFSRDRKTFLLRFQYPPITPANPLVVTLFSKTAIRIQKIELNPQW